MQVQIGDTAFTLVVSRRHGLWTANALRAEDGERYGLEVTASTESDATNRLRRWLEWQHEHAQMLEALQDAERVYHRAVAGAAFSSAEARFSDTKTARDGVDAARHQLDDVRARRPNV